MTIGVLEVSGVASPERRTSGFDDPSAGGGRSLHQGVDFLSAPNSVPQRKIRWISRRGLQAGVARNAGAGPERKDKPALELEERDCSVVEFLADDAFGREPQPVAIEGERALKVVDAKRYDSETRFQTSDSGLVLIAPAMTPNGSRLSCERHARGRKELSPWQRVSTRGAQMKDFLQPRSSASSAG